MRLGGLGVAAALMTAGHVAHASALKELATRLLGEVAAPKGTLVVAAPVASDVPLTRDEELPLRLAQVIAGQSGEPLRAAPKALSLPLARAAAGRSAALLFVELSIRKGTLEATADLYPAVRNGWERLKNPAPAPTAHAFAETPIDAEIRSFLPPILLEAAVVKKARIDVGGEVLALGCLDMDGVRGAEIVAVTRGAVALGRLRDGKFQRLASAPWSKLAPALPTRLREPLAWVVASDRAVGAWVGITDRGSVFIDASMTAKERSPGLVAGAGTCARVVPQASSVDLFAGAPPCALDGAAAPLARGDAVAAATAIMKDGEARSVVASRDPAGRIHVRVGADEARDLMDGRGAQLALGDLDLDGAIDVITSLDADAGDDSIVISTLGREKERRRIVAKGGVRALAVCPPEEAGKPALLAAVGDEVWLVR